VRRSRRAFVAWPPFAVLNLNAVQQHGQFARPNLDGSCVQVTRLGTLEAAFGKLLAINHVSVTVPKQDLERLLLNSRRITHHFLLPSAPIPRRPARSRSCGSEPLEHLPNQFGLDAIGDLFPVDNIQTGHGLAADVLALACGRRPFFADAFVGKKFAVLGQSQCSSSEIVGSSFFHSRSTHSSSDS
jgi:hypothetical protein